MLKSKSIGACLALTFALLFGSGMTTYADTGAVNTEEINKENTEKENKEDGAETAQELTSSVVEAGNISSARKAAAKAAKAAAELAREKKERCPVVEAGISGNASKSEAASVETAGEAAAADTEEQDAAKEAEASQESAGTAVSQESQPTGLRSLGVFRTTGYCPCHQCSEGWGRHTCTGAIAQANHTIAVDPRVIPYGSRVMINGVIYTAEDRGGGVKGNHIDIFYDTHAQTRQHGSRNQEVYLLS